MFVSISYALLSAVLTSLQNLGQQMLIQEVLQGTDQVRTNERKTSVHHVHGESLKTTPVAYRGSTSLGYNL